MRERLEDLRREAEEAIAGASSLNEVKEIRVRFLGRKGEITQVLRGIKDLPEAERMTVGKIANELKLRLETLLEDKLEQLKQAEEKLRLYRECIDVTLPGIPVNAGSKHPLSQILEEIKEVFTTMGFEIAEGPEIELDYYNFEALNIPPDHPARDMQDSFYVTDQVLLRTHTSPVQVRTMERKRPALPVRIIAPGTVYRRDDDATHSPMFHQVEGLVIDRGITFADLKGTLMLFARQLFGEDRKVRFRPSFFPFTEPSAEMDISCGSCGGEGCRVCSGTGWLEILGAGMVHPKVLSMSGYDPEEATGFAFGLGIERIAMLKFGIRDLRLFFDNDVRFLKQF
ncbi:MAG: phenylalanine--tRNA ligase subunit alpha [Syntrophothermus sp.]|uniref:phenylalanine--tRNA ligase subunit alpha n=1 Tax=Syntrophothermus sp. TaxID=2736299 RepID=UPI00257F68B3|nr:phenylalanine--tRNA ligase subunit alpha [Syntrophothermus sp.]NSW81942.1 phenylalanine--tRNA ligase subunit alpha [Syntrophothermus sp.]